MVESIVKYYYIGKVYQMKNIIILLFLLTFIFAKDLVLGVVPQQSPLKLSKKWIKITKQLSKETGINIIFKTENSIPAFQKKLYKGEYDLAYMNPYHFIIANDSQAYEAKIRADKLIRGIIVSKEKILDLEKLKDTTFLFPAPKAFAATLLTKYEFKKKFDFDIEKDAKILYVNSHDSVYKGVARGIGNYGGGIIRTYNNFKEQKDKENINIIYTTDGYPSHPIAFHPRVDKKDQEKIVKALLNMPRELLDILSIKKFIQTDTKEYEVIRKFK